MEGMTDNVKKIIIAVVVLLVIAAGAYVFGGFLHRDGGSAADVRKQLDQIAADQRDAAARLVTIDKGLADGAKRTDAIAATIGHAQGTITVVTERGKVDAAGLAESQRIIGSSQQVLRTIRQGTEVKTGRP